APLVARVQAALLLRRAAPAPGALILAKHHRSRARPATDARKALIVQRVVRNVMVRNQFPDVFLGPIGQRADLHQSELLVPAHDRNARTIAGSLVATNAAHPGAPTDHRLAQDLYLAIAAALVGVCLVKRTAVQRLVLFDGRLGPAHLDLHAIALGD